VGVSIRRRPVRVVGTNTKSKYLVRAEAAASQYNVTHDDDDEYYYIETLSRLKYNAMSDGLAAHCTAH
jgi:hypothetical protein